MDGNCLEVSWKECLEIVLESLGLELVLHKLKPFTSHGKYVWWDARALSPCGAEVTVVLRNSALPFKEYPDGSKIWYPISNAYGSSEEEACNNYLRFISGNDLVLSSREDLALSRSKRKTVIQVPSLDSSSLETLRIDLDLLGIRRKEENQEREIVKNLRI